MRLCWSSVSYWPQMKVTLFVKSNSLVLILGLFLGLDTVAVYTSPVQVHSNSHQLHYCNFTSTGKNYTIIDLLQCMNELALITTTKRHVRSIDENIQFFPKSSETREHLQYSPHQQSPIHHTPVNLNKGPSYLANRRGYYKYPPALPPGYPLTSDSSFTSGILGINLVDALSSISKYDDLKCVPRIICEVATGVTPGNTEYKQSYVSTGMNALIGLLTAVDSSDTSPLLNFGKSALMGYANRGNPGICYRRYSKCPQNPNEVVNYLNNHNGGFFRFFNNRQTGIRYRENLDNEVLPVSDNLVSHRRGTGELKFDTTTPIIKMKSSDYHDKKRDVTAITFPDSQRHSNRVIKSFDYDSENFYRPVIEQKKNFFPQDSMEKNLAKELYSGNHHSDDWTWGQ